MIHDIYIGADTVLALSIVSGEKQSNIESPVTSKDRELIPEPETAEPDECLEDVFTAKSR